MKKLTALVLLCLVSWNAWADCVSPPAKRGQVQWYSGALILCDGANWNSFSLTGNQGSCDPGQAGKIVYTGSSDKDLVVCDGSQFKRLKTGSAGAPCSTAAGGKFYFHSGDGDFLFCDGTNWFTLMDKDADCFGPVAPTKAQLCSDGTYYVGTDGTKRFAITKVDGEPVGPLAWASSYHTDAFVDVSGKANSDAILVKDASSPAFGFCRDSEYAGHDDWYIPSLNEFITYIGPGKLRLDLLQTSGKYYWTSYRAVSQNPDYFNMNTVSSAHLLSDTSQALVRCMREYTVP